MGSSLLQLTRGLQEALTPLDVTRKDYEDLATLLHSAQQLGLDREEVAQSVKTSVPRLAMVGDLLLSNKGTAIATWITVILTVLMMIQTATVTEEPAQPPSVTVVVQKPSEDEIKRWIEEAVKQQSAQDYKDHPKTAPPNQKK